MQKIIATGWVLFLMLTTAQAQIGWRVDTTKPALWRPVPGWLGNPAQSARVERTAEGLRFVVPEAGKGMKWLVPARWVNTQRFRYLTVRYRARGIAPNLGDYFLYLNDNSDLPDSARYMLYLSDLHADGRWHWAVVDLRQRQVRPYLSQMALQVQAAEPDAEVGIAEIAFRDTLPAGVSVATEPAQPYREQLLPLSELGRLQPQPDWLSNPSARASVETKSDGVHLRVPEVGRGMKWSLNLHNPLRLHETPYVVVQYRASGVVSSGDYFLYLAPEQSNLPQEQYTPMRLNEVVSLGKWRTLVARVPEATLDGLATLAIQLQAGEPNAEVVIRSIRFTSAPHEQLVSLEDELPEPRIATGRGYTPVNLSACYNMNLKQVAGGLLLNGYRFRSEQVVAAGVPFHVSTGERNVASIAGEVGSISVPIPPSLQRQVPSEVYLLIAADFPQWEEPAYGGGTLYRVQHPHRFTVELIDVGGNSEQIFPLRVASRRHEVVAGVDVYVVPVSRRLKEVRLHDRMRLGEFGLCAVTLNMGKRWFAPSLWKATVPATGRKGAWNPPSSPLVTQQGSEVVLRSANVLVRIDTAQGIYLKEVSLLPIRQNVLAQPVPLFTVGSWDGNLTANSRGYRVQDISMHADGAQIECAPPHSSLPAVSLRLQMDSLSRIRIEATLRNQQGNTHRWVFFPATWMGVPYWKRRCLHLSAAHPAD